MAALRAHQERWPAGKRDRVFREPGKGRELVMPTRVRDLWARARDAKKLKRQPTRDELDIAEYRAAQLACLLRGHHDAVDGEAVGPCLGLFGRSLLY